MRDKTAGLDCVIVGYHESDLREEIKSATQMREHSAHLLSLLTNTVAHQGERLTYLDLLNKVVKDRTGVDPRLHVGSMPNLGVTYLRNFLAKSGHKVDSINFFDYERERLRQLLTSRFVRSVAITTTFYTSDGPVKAIADYVRDLSPETKIIVGGPHILNLCSYQKPEVVEYCVRVMGADYYIFDAQGEGTLSALLRELASTQGDVLRVPNLVVVGEEVVWTPKAPEANDLEKHRVDWRSLPLSHCTPTVMTRTARSCAFKCSFCTYPVLAGKLTLMGVDAIEEELKELDELGATNVAFIDDTFNVPPERFKQICRMIIRNKFGFKWFSYLRCGNIDSEGLDLLAASGCAGVFLGIESGDDQVLLNMNKKADAERYREGIKGLRERGIASYASIIVGFPGETSESVDRTIDLLCDAKPTYFHPELYCHYQFSPVNARAAEFSLKGNGYSWAHGTMDWKQAQEHLIRMIERVGENSIYLPTYSFDFWALPYLHGVGFSKAFIDSFLAACNKGMLEGLVDGSSTVAYDELVRVVDRGWPTLAQTTQSALELA